MFVHIFFVPKDKIYYSTGYISVELMYLPMEDYNAYEQNQEAIQPRFTAGQYITRVVAYG